MLAWLDEEDYKTTFWFERDASTGVTLVTPLSEVPRLRDVIRRHPISDLFAGGWLETVS